MTKAEIKMNKNYIDLKATNMNNNDKIPLTLNQKI